MALGRNTVVRPTDFNLPVLQLPFEALYGQMQQYQSDYDTMGQLSSITPNYIEKDTEWANKYKQYANEISTAVTDAFASGNTSQALRTLRSAQQALGNEWKPGGLAYALQDRYTSYNQGLEQLQKAHEKDPTQMNYQYGSNQFQTGVKDLEYDYKTQKYNRIGQPNIYNYTSISDRLRDEVKTIIPDVTEKDFINGMWIERLKEKGYDDNRIKSIWQGILNSPEIQQQLTVEAYNKVGNLSEEDKKKYVESSAASIKSEKDRVKRELSKLSVIDKQKYLKQIGLYNGSIDGKDEPMTQEAVAALEQQYDEKYKAILESNPDALLINDLVVKPYEQQFMGYFGKENSHTVRPNAVALQQQRLAHAAKLQQNEFIFQQSLLQKESENGLYTPSQAIDITQHLSKARQDAKELAVESEKDLKNVLKNAGIKDQEVLQRNLTAFEKSDNFEDFKKQFPGIDPNALFNTYTDLKANAATYKESLVNVAKAHDILARVDQEEVEIYKQAASNVFDKPYNRLKINKETKEEFIKSATIAAAMTHDELKNSKDPSISRFYRKYGPTFNNNDAKILIEKAKKETSTLIKSGKFIPNNQIRYSLSGLNPNYGGGRLSAAVKQDLKSGSLYGYEDFTTGNRDEFTDIHGKKVKIDNLDPSTANVEYDSGWGQPSYFITAKDNTDKTYKTIRVKPPATHSSLIETVLDQEIAIGVNNGDLKSAARAARFREEQNGNILDIAGGSIKPTNKNIVGTKLQAKLNDSVVELDRPYTSAYKTDYAGVYDLEIITFTDRDGKQKWATALTDDKGNRSIVGKAEKRDGTIKPRLTHTNLADMLYSSYGDALDNVSLFKAVNEIPVQQVYETIPKDLKGMNLGQRNTKINIDIAPQNEED